MSRLILLIALLAAPAAFAEGEDTAAEDKQQEKVATDNNGDGISSPKTMSGMSILGNEETPKSLVIVPWKSSEMGDAISLQDTLDDRATPVDKEVFLRELRYYEIRKQER
ncbi:MAG: hypothetical protein OEY37_01460 [Gammaproteobacteria bacterium]|nr:hypothetical protein [Gammaproteobacteria bacterium]MDH5618439.1 hypothetical protein [Gammaproteobacteria bacterium]